MMISVIVPVYNVEKYLRKCVESICNQTYKDNRIKVIHKQNGGSTSARNAGLAVSTGEYIGFVDSDDWIEPEIIYYDMEIRNEGIWAKEQSAHRNNVFVFNTLFKDGKDFYVKLTEHSELIVEAWRQMIRKDFLLYNAISFYDGIYHEDVLFSFKCAMKAVKVSYLQKELYVYRRRDNSIMSAYNFKRAQSLFIVIIELWNMWKNEAYEDSVDKVFERALTNFYKEFIRISSCYWDMELSDFGSAADKFLYPIMSGKK